MLLQEPSILQKLKPMYSFLKPLNYLLNFTSMLHTPKKGVPGTLVQNTKDSAAIPTIRDPPRISYPILYEAKVPWHQQRP